LTPRKDPKDLLKTGRKTVFQEKYIDKAYDMALLGLTDKGLARVFEVTEQTITLWKKKYPKFFASLKRGKEEADAKIVKSLHERASGYKHKETKVFMHEGQIVEAEITKHCPPDPTSMIFWLKNRQPKQWRDKIESENTNTEKIEITFIEVGK